MIDIGVSKAEEEGFEPPVRCRTTVFKTEQDMMQIFSPKRLSDNSEDLLQENLQDRSECIQNALPDELFEVVCKWEELPGHVKDTIRMLVETAGKKSNNSK
ncbi:MAG: hypothetical protein ACYSOJ_08685, partial [Planctomycetota bacterium]